MILLNGQLLIIFFNEDNIFQQFETANENQEKAITSQELPLPSGKSHPKSCYISRCIHTLYGLYNSLEYIKSGKTRGIILV